jgi:sugar diacid utilization regulator
MGDHVDQVAAAHQSVPVGLREQLTNLRALLVLSILMTETTEEGQILRLAASSAPSLASWRIVGFMLGDGTWRAGTDMDRTETAPPELAAQLAELSDAGGAVEVPEFAWGWAYPLRSVSGPLGYLVAGCAEPPSADEQFLAQVVAQHTGVAISNARLHQKERATAAALAESNAALEDTVATLRRGMQIHQRLTQVAAGAEGSAGIADALHELTRLPVAIEDRYGKPRAWAGPDRPDPYPKPNADERDRLVRRLLGEPRSIRHGDRIYAIALPRPDVVGIVSLVDPDRTADQSDLVALEHGATVLAVELARLRGLADAELRLRRDLLHDLLAGTDDESAYARAEALDYDLEPPHRVVLVEPDRVDDPRLHAVRRALRELRLPGLLGTLSGAVVVLVGQDADWEALRQAVLRESGGGSARLAVGGRCARPSALPRSLREAQLVLRLQKSLDADERATTYDDLGVFRMFASTPDLGDVAEFARRWLGALIDYDEAKNTDLVHTLSRYLDNGGHYETTAAALRIHRSTLKYRLARIRELTGLDLSDPEVHFNLCLATRAWLTLAALRD